MEFEDPEFFQMTLNKLEKELDGVKKECQHWKEAAKSQVNYSNQLFFKCELLVINCSLNMSF